MWRIIWCISWDSSSVPKTGKPAGSGKLKKKGTWYNVKHCTVTPYLYAARIHAAMNNGAVLTTDGIEMEQLAIEIKRDKNSECFSVDGRPDYREWLDVIPVPPNSKKRQRIEVICRDDGKLDDSLFADCGGDLMFRKRRKATGCPEFAAVVETVTKSDIDLGWYAADKAVEDKNGGDTGTELWE